MMATAVSTASSAPATGYAAVPLVGLVSADAVPFPLYLRTGDSTWVLYHPAASALDASHVGRLQAEGVTQLFIRESDRPAYFARVEQAIDGVLLDRHVPINARADVLHGVAMRVADDLLKAPPDRSTIARSQKVMMATAGLLLREQAGFQAIRRVIGANPGLAEHSLTVGFLAMGLSRIVLTGDAATLLHAGLGGLLHDVGKVGHEGLEHDPEHAARGADQLRVLGLPTAVVDAARYHHERQDGSGFPRALRGEAIPDLARVVGVVDTFHKVYATQQPRVGVFDALRILAQAYRGAFEERLATGLVQLFR